ncbi:MAG: RHS repeat domain-containing protein [Pyrinomonadaceae bacterium]
MSTSTNRVTTSGWEYDLAGNLVRGQDASGVWQRFEYDAAGRLKKVMDDSSTVLETYTYGATRERLLMENSINRTYYVWGGQSVIAAYGEKSTGTAPSHGRSFIYAGSRLLMTVSKATGGTEKQEFHHPDRLGTQLVTNGGTGSSFRQTTFPFGTKIAAETTGNTNQVFTSYDRSSGSGLDYAVNRTYSPGQSRFTQVDPIGMASASIGNPQSNNLYAYVQNMPTDFTDPSGLNMSGGFFVCYDVTTYSSNESGTKLHLSTTTVCWTFGVGVNSHESGMTGDYSGGAANNPQTDDQETTCKGIIAKATGEIKNFLAEWQKYDPAKDALGGIKHKYGVTQPFGHWRKLKSIQGAMKKIIEKYDRDCNDRNDGRGGRGGGLPHGIRSLSTQLIPRKEGPGMKIPSVTRKQFEEALNTSVKSAGAGAAAAAAAAAAILWIIVM